MGQYYLCIVLIIFLFILLIHELIWDFRSIQKPYKRILLCLVLTLLFKYNYGVYFYGLEYEDAYAFSFCARQFLYSRPLKDVFLLNSQQINVRFALRYLQVFLSLRLKTCILYDKQDLSPALIVQFVGRPTEPQTSLVSARRQD